MKKKILSLVLAMLMVSGSAGVVAADDAASEANYEPAIEFLHSYGIYKGYTEEDLAAEKDIERYQMALFAARISTGWVDDEKWEDGPLNTSGFTDIEDGETASSYLGAISYAQQKGIIEGYGNGEFGPYDGITYQDALTMVCRTLGYTGEDWPWGYIEKAVELELTEGVVDVAYTDILTRGEVAQIIYNALFAAKNGGSTLAKDVFGMSDWTPIIITASDAVVFTKDGKTVADVAADTWVEFKEFDPATGYIKAGAEAFYAEAADLGLDVAKHEDDMAVGHTYWAIFEESANNFVDVLEFESTVVDTLWNKGKTDDEGNPITYDVKDYLEGRTVVTKYTPANYISNTKKLKPEIILYNAVDAIEESVKEVSSLLAIDWNTGDILVYNEETKEYDVLWIWNATVQNYFRYKVDANGLYVGLDWMEDGEFDVNDEDFLKYDDVVDDDGNIIKKYTGTIQLEAAPDNTAWSSLTLIDADLDVNGVAERAFYEEYELAKVAVGTDKCKACDKEDVVTYTFTDVSDKMAAAIDAGIGEYSSKGTLPGSTVTMYSCCGVFAEGFEYKQDGYVMYNWDAEAKIAKIVKTIDGSDKDSYVASGILRGYSVELAKVVIDDKAYTAKYDELKNTGFLKVVDNKTEYANGLDSMLNQYVTYVVMDGEVVAMNLEAAGANGTYLVVKNFLGMSDDGYIAVEAYNLANGALDIYFIASYNGWKQGDYYYFLTADKVADAFAAGTIYYVKSYDKNDDLYNVELVGDWDRTESRGEYEVDDERLNLTETTITFANDGYKCVNGKWSKMDVGDVYVILPKLERNTPVAPIFVHKGKITDSDWKVKGDRITGIGDNVFVIVNVDTTDTANNEGFLLDAYESGMYLYEGGKVWEATYEGAYNTLFGEGIGPKDRYIVGATTYKVEVFDLYHGKVDAVVVDRNIDLEENHVYVTISDKIVEEFKPLTDEISLTGVAGFINEMATTYYADRSIDPKFADTADYLFGYFTLTSAEPIKEITKDHVAEALAKEDVTAEGSLTNGWYDHNRERVSDLKVWTVAFPTADTMTVVKEGIPEDAFALACGYVYDVSEGTAVVYVMAAGKVEKLEEEVEFETSVKGVEIVAKFEYTNYFKVDGTLDYAKINSVEFFFDGADAMGHNDRAIAGIGFGHLSQHAAGSYLTENDGLWYNDGTPDLLVDLYLNRNTAATYTKFACADELCDLVKSIKFEFAEPIVVDEDDADRIALVLNVAPALPNLESDEVALTAEWGVYVDITATDAGLEFAADEEASTINANGFLAYVPEDLQK